MTPCVRVAAFLWAAAVLGDPAAGQLEVERDWIRQFGTPGDDVGYAVIVDGAGGVVIGGTTGGSLGGPLIGTSDAFLARYDGDGEFTWIRQFGADVDETVRALVPDGKGGVYAAGSQSDCCFSRAFVARYDSEGEEVWFELLKSGKGDTANGIAPDGQGGVFVCGQTFGEIGGPNAGDGDTFLARFNDKGERLWVVQFGTTERELASALAPDGKGGVFLTGSTRGDLEGSNAGGFDGYVARYSGKGVEQWIVQFGSDGDDVAEAILADGSGEAFVAGRTDGSLGGANAGGLDAFVVCFLDGKKTGLWQFGTASPDLAWGLASDGVGGVIIAGDTRGPLAGETFGDYDTFLMGMDAAGQLQPLAQFGSAGAESLRGMGADGHGGVVLAGASRGALGGPHAGGADATGARFRAPEPPGCEADCDGNGVLDLFDFLCFVNLFNAGC